ncbi:MAG: hypothetical protein FD179_1010 [Erysipelotrichaceae bacterium]|nr:MAG: hypothetical protein FD179_1010 [Erysipelotrichaceae bacterium]
MFDLNNIITRYFTLSINNTQLEVEPPRVKTLKKLIAVQKSEDYDAFIEVMSEVLSKNRQNKKITVEMLDGIDVDVLNEISVQYFTWLSEVKNNPNL